MIQIEPRKNPPSKDKAFQLMGAELISRPDFLKLCKINKPPPALIEQFKADIRGHNSLQIILICDFFYKLIWFGYEDAQLAACRARKPEASKMVRFTSSSIISQRFVDIVSQGADYWEDGLKDAIEAGDRG